MIDLLHDGSPSTASPFAGVRDFALAELDTMKADLVRASDPEVTIEFAIDGRHMFVGDREVCELLGAITTTIPKGCMTLYCIAPRDRDERAAQVIRDFFTESKRKGDGRSRDNQRLSSVLYVGTSRKMATRTKEHLGFCSRSTYGLKLSEWYPAADLPLRLTCSVFPLGTSGTVVSVLEDALWERLRPMFGRKGARRLGWQRLECRGSRIVAERDRTLPPSMLADLGDRRSGRWRRQARRMDHRMQTIGVAIPDLLMCGPPGSGKSLMAACLPGILPPLDAAEALEVSMVQSVAGTLAGGRLTRVRPFRHPHHSASMAALTGGGLKVKPGEVSLAHLGVLFLDELPEFQRVVLDSLRQPLETGSVSVARANAHVTFPARVQLIAAMNPCRCGHLGDAALACARAPRCAADYQAKVSGPLLDRIDIHIDVQPVSAVDLMLPPPAEGSAEVAARVAAARGVQAARYDGQGVRTNAEADGTLLDRVATPDEAGRALLAQAAEAMRLTARGFTRILRVARTIADLEGSETVRRLHVAEALSYRRRPPVN